MPSSQRARQQRRAEILAQAEPEPDRASAGAAPPLRAPTPWSMVQRLARPRSTWKNVVEGKTPLLQQMAAAVEATMVSTPRPHRVRGRDGLVPSDGTVTVYAADGRVRVEAFADPLALRPWERLAAPEHAADHAPGPDLPESVLGDDGALYVPLGGR
ncbi:hypothetical protein [Streptomyces sp. NPDC056401]|uniref:hypothetical protein n=1 Tax=Streptomyces sp. NPDC056401 TaxID=3345809 RepID=UPI0035D62AD0